MALNLNKLDDNSKNKSQYLSKIKQDYKIIQKNLEVELGKIPPQSLDLEEAVLGALMLDQTAFDAVGELLKPKTFYKTEHQLIFEAIRELGSRHQTIDLLTVTEQLRRTDNLENAGGPFYLTQLSRNIASSAHIEFHTRIVIQKYIQRELIGAATKILHEAYDDTKDVLDLINFSEAEIFNVAEGNIKKETQEIKPLLEEAFKRIEEAGKNKDGFGSVKCGFHEIDKMTTGWQNSDMIIVAARPSMGKTAFVLSMARNIAIDTKKGVAIFSLEMSAIQLVNRLIVGETGLSSEKIKTGRLEDWEWEQLSLRTNELNEAPLYIDDTPAITIFELRSKCRRLLKMKHPAEIIIIDYLQLMSGGNDSHRGNRETEVADISKALKALAKELDVPIIALSQLNRAVEKRGGKMKPQLSDLRESGSIEQDADMVLFIHRPEYYGLDEEEESVSTQKGLAEIIIAKHRNGPTGTVNLKFIQEQARFVNFDEDMIGFSTSSNGTYSSKLNNNSESNKDLPINKSFDDYSINDGTNQDDAF